MKLLDLYEKASPSTSAPAGIGKIIGYLGKKLGTSFIRIPGVEHFKNSTTSGYGIRFVENGKTNCIRFNWNSEGQMGKLTTLSSIDIFTGKTHDPNYTIHTKGVTILQALPVIIAKLENPEIGNEIVFPVDPKQALTEAVVMEVAKDHFTPEQALTDFLHQLGSGQTFTRTGFIQRYHQVHVGIFDTVMDNFADRFMVDGKRISLASNKGLDSLKDAILGKAGVVEVTKGGTKETYLRTPQEDAVEKEAPDRVPYTDTLDHLEGLVQALIKGSFNALFVAGKGGTGKTQTVERVLHANGLTDGTGYFKNTGSASASGIYTLLYHHRNDIILFDDSDGALNDQDARNLIKAATDTKKLRKLVWNKKSSFIFNPEETDPKEYEDDLTMAPQYFDFKGRIIFISNLKMDKLDPDGALRTRAFVIELDPTDDEMFQHMGKILMDIRLEDGLDLSADQRKHVLEVVKGSKAKREVSLRKLVRALNLAASGAPNWEKLVELYS